MVVKRPCVLEVLSQFKRAFLTGRMPEATTCTCALASAMCQSKPQHSFLVAAAVAPRDEYVARSGRRMKTPDSHLRYEQSVSTASAGVRRSTSEERALRL